MTDDLHPSTHDWHVGTDGMELLIRRDAADSVGVHLGHENIDDAHATTIVTSRLLEMIDAVQPGAVRAHLAAQDPTDAEVEALARMTTEEVSGCDWASFGEDARNYHRDTARRRLTAARAAQRDEEKR